MRVGVTLFAQNYSDWDRFYDGSWDDNPKVSDAEIYEQEIEIGALVEPLGFDSMWTVEHHFTPYTMDNHPLQFLSFFAGMTHRIDFGTMVVVLPWHDPLRVAEQAAMFDCFLKGRKLYLGLGRGQAPIEFDGLRVDYSESRPRMVEGLEVVKKALTQKHFSHQGRFFSIPDVSIRPQPRSSDLVDRLYMPLSSPDSAANAAEHGLNPLIIPQSDWASQVELLEGYNRIRMERGFGPSKPIVLLATYVHEDPEVAERVGRLHALQYGDSAGRHYGYGLTPAEQLERMKIVPRYDEITGSQTTRQFADEHQDAADRVRRVFAERMAESDSGDGTPSPAQMRQLMAQQFASVHVWGTPDQVYEKIEARMIGLGASEYCGVFKFGDMSLDVAEQSLRLFAREVLPRLHALETPPPRLPEPATS
jgi:alkanesulfonate monooxygenase SsuD/methylene tetrahydromethanopterin reductase-like flavin-dependent oxidoreductase (luciferase family)